MRRVLVDGSPDDKAKAVNKRVGRMIAPTPFETLQTVFIRS
jgi:hypothetical protein